MTSVVLVGVVNNLTHSCLLHCQVPFHQILHPIYPFPLHCHVPPNYPSYIFSPLSCTIQLSILSIHFTPFLSTCHAQFYIINCNSWNLYSYSHDVSITVLVSAFTVLCCFLIIIILFFAEPKPSTGKCTFVNFINNFINNNFNVENTKDVPRRSQHCLVMTDRCANLARVESKVKFYGTLENYIAWGIAKCNIMFSSAIRDDIA